MTVEKWTMHAHRVAALLLGAIVLFAAWGLGNPNPNPPANAATTAGCADPSAATLPGVQHWPHRPIFMKAGSGTHVRGINPGEALPLGVPFEFETPLFKGKILVRLRHCKTDSAHHHDAYFRGTSRVMQTVLQGQFKRPVNMADLFVGTTFQRPFRMVPPPFVARILNAVLSRVSPSAVLDLASPQPKVMSLYAGTAHSLSRDAPGQEPDMTAPELPENVHTILATSTGSQQQQQQQNDTTLAFTSVQERRRKLSVPRTAAHYHFDSDSIYTLHIYDEVMDVGQHHIKLPLVGNFDLIQAIGPQPMTLSAMTIDGQVLYDLDVWHERAWTNRMMETAATTAAATTSDEYK
jgi:hypothetical protein